MPTPAPPDHPGTRVRLRRLQAGLTQTGLADRLGRTQGWVSKVESGVVELDRISVVNEVAAILGAHPRDLVAAPGPSTGDSQDALLARTVLAELRRYDLPSPPGTRVTPAGLQQRLDVIHDARDRADCGRCSPCCQGCDRASPDNHRSRPAARPPRVYVVACRPPTPAPTPSGIANWSSRGAAAGRGASRNNATQLPPACGPGHVDLSGLDSRAVTDAACTAGR
jgi:transcriptional regulator with XRE-family HTH domain